MSKYDIEAHEFAAIFPLATDDELREMAADIKQRSLLHPIVLLGGKVLDGRNRLRACKLAGVEPDFTNYVGTDPLADVVSWNLHRRQMSTSQRAALAVSLKPMFEKQAKERMRAAGGDHGNQHTGGKSAGKANLPEPPKGQSRDQAAAAVGVSGRLVGYAEKVKREAPEMFEAIKAGTKTVDAARKEVEAATPRPKPKEDEQPQKRRTLKQRGTYEDWVKFRELAESVKDVVREMDTLKIDLQHVIPARTLCEQLATRFTKLAQTIGG